VRPCHLLFSQGGRCSDARILEEPRKSRKSHGSGRLENAFSLEKVKEREGERKSEEDRMKKLLERTNSCASSFAEIK